jgi:hypothetical protein
MYLGSNSATASYVSGLVKTVFVVGETPVNLSFLLVVPSRRITVGDSMSHEPVVDWGP